MAHHRLTRKLNDTPLADVSDREDAVTSFIRAKALAKQWDCDVRTIKRMILRGELRGYRRGGAIVVARADAQKYIEANQIKPVVASA